MKEITVITYDKCWAMNVMIVNDFFAIVERLQRHLGVPPDFSCRVASYNGMPVISASTSQIHPTHCLKDIQTTDLIVVPPIEGIALNSDIQGKENLLSWLKSRYQSGSKILAITTGVFLVAEAGLLDGKVATTHWAFLKTMRALYPDSRFIANKSFTYSERIFTTGTFNGCMDVLLHYIASVKGEHFSQQCAAHGLVSSPELLNPVLLDRRNHDDEFIIEIQDWIEENYKLSINIEHMAKRFDINLRSLKRRFKTATGLSPIQYLQRVRMDKAKTLLVATDKSVSEISYSVGYENCSFFIRLFKRNFDLTPMQWRNL